MIHIPDTAGFIVRNFSGDLEQRRMKALIIPEENAWEVLSQFARKKDYRISIAASGLPRASRSDHNEGYLLGSDSSPLRGHIRLV